MKFFPQNFFPGTDRPTFGIIEAPLPELKKGEINFHGHGDARRRGMSDLLTSGVLNNPSIETPVFCLRVPDGGWWVVGGGCYSYLFCPPVIFFILVSINTGAFKKRVRRRGIHFVEKIAL